MKLLFCYDGPILVDAYNNSYEGTMTDEIWKRYFEIADEIKVVTRVNVIDSNLIKEKKNNINHLDIIACPDILSFKGQLYKKNQARKILDKAVQNTDYVLVRLPGLIGNLAIESARKYNKPYLIELVANPWDTYWTHSLKGKMIAPIMHRQTLKHIRNAEYVLYVTNEYLQNKYPTEGKSIGVSDVALESTDNTILNNRLSKISSIKNNEKIILGTAGAIDVKYKGQQYVIEALGRLKKRGFENFKYQIVGGGNPKFLKQLAEKNNVDDQVEFIGLLNHREVFKWLDSIDIYIQPSLTEGLPRALVEAMSRALPAYGSDAGGIYELLDSNVIFSNKNNIKELENILLNIREEDLKNQAKINFTNAKKYQKDTLDSKRKEFFRDFVESYL